MHIIVLADEFSRQEFSMKINGRNVHLTFVEELSEISNQEVADAIFLLKDGLQSAGYKAITGNPVFINCTIHTLKELDLPPNFSRINGWATFLNREIWEIATTDEKAVKNIFERLEWKYITVADEPGLVSARIISMIINEAYFALGEDVSSEEEIDLAMKLGTNHPYGPFEWSRIIGLKNILSLLEKLSITDSRYSPAAALKKELS